MATAGLSERAMIRVLLKLTKKPTLRRFFSFYHSSECYSDRCSLPNNAMAAAFISLFS